MTDGSVTAPAPKVPCIIAVDGPAASGKGTLARRLAAHYDFAYLDTGALYRAVAAAFATSPKSFQLLRRRDGDWRVVVDDADLRAALEQAAQLRCSSSRRRSPYEKSPAASPSGEPRGIER